MPRVYTDYDLAVIRNRNGENVPLPPKPKRRKRNNEESRIQQAVIVWWRNVCMNRYNLPEILLFAVGNGGARSEITGAIMKREGVRRGTSDLILMVKRGRFGALAIEMKKPDGVATEEQRAFIKAVIAQGYAGKFCYSYAGAVETIEAYLAL